MSNQLVKIQRELLAPRTHIILLGFKHVGKSTVGRALAKALQRPFIDLDWQIEQNYQRQTQATLSCREIFNHHGEDFFRNCETQALREVIGLPAAVMALGGGTPLRSENQMLIKPYWLVHITADPQVVYERMMAGGKPAFFPDNQDPLEYFQRLWKQRQTVYASLADLTVDNTQSVEQTVMRILSNFSENRGK